MIESLGQIESLESTSRDCKAILEADYPSILISEKEGQSAFQFHLVFQLQSGFITSPFASQFYRDIFDTPESWLKNGLWMESGERYTRILPRFGSNDHREDPSHFIYNVGYGLRLVLPIRLSPSVLDSIIISSTRIWPWDWFASDVTVDATSSVSISVLISLIGLVVVGSSVG